MPKGIYKRTERNNHTQEAKDAIGNANRGRKKSQETIDKHAAACSRTWERKRKEQEQ